MTTRSKPDAARETIHRLLMSQRQAKGPGLTICPTQVAKALEASDGPPSTEGDAWRTWLPLVRRTAVEMALSGDLTIKRKGKPVDPESFKGIYRLALPGDGDGQTSDE